MILHPHLPGYRGLWKPELPQVIQILYNDLLPARLVTMVQYPDHERPRWQLSEPSPPASPAAADARQASGASQAARGNSQTAPSSGNLAAAACGPAPAAGLAAGNGKVYNWLAGSESAGLSAASGACVQHSRAGSGNKTEAASVYTLAASSSTGDVLSCPAASHPCSLSCQITMTTPRWVGCFSASGSLPHGDVSQRSSARHSSTRRSVAGKQRALLNCG